MAEAGTFCKLPVSLYAAFVAHHPLVSDHLTKLIA